MSKKSIIIRMIVSIVLIGIVAYHYFLKVPTFEKGQTLEFEIINEFTPNDIIDRGGRVVLTESSNGNYIEVTLNNYRDADDIDIYLLDGQVIISYNEKSDSDKKDRMLHIYYESIDQIKSSKIYKNGLRQTRILVLQSKLKEH